MNNVLIKDTGISTRTINALNRAHFYSLMDLANTSALDLQCIRGCGAKMLIEINETLKSYGFELKDFKQASESECGNLVDFQSKKQLTAFKNRQKEITRHRIEKYLSPNDLVEILGVSRNTVYALFKLPNFPTVKIGKRLLVSESAFHEWMHRGGCTEL